MKPLVVVLIAVVTFALGFLSGGGLGFFGGSVAGAIAGAGMGSCAAVLTAIDEKYLTDAQAGSLAQSIGRKLHATNPDLNLSELKPHATSTSAPAESSKCDGFLTGVKAGFEAAK